MPIKRETKRSEGRKSKMNKKTVVVWLIIILVAVEAANELSYLGARDLFGSLTGRAPLQTPSGTKYDIGTYMFNSTTPNTTISIAPFGIQLDWNQQTQTLTWTSGPSDYVLGTFLVSSHYSSPYWIILSSPQFTKGNGCYSISCYYLDNPDIWMWNPGDHVTYTFTGSAQMTLHIYVQSGKMN